METLILTAAVWLIGLLPCPVAADTANSSNFTAAHAQQPAAAYAAQKKVVAAAIEDHCKSIDGKFDLNYTSERDGWDGFLLRCDLPDGKKYEGKIAWQDKKGSGITQQIMRFSGVGIELINPCHYSYKFRPVIVSPDDAQQTICYFQTGHLAVVDTKNDDMWITLTELSK